MYEVKITLPITFSPDAYEEGRPEASREEIIEFMKQDFLDCIYRQWTEEETLDYLEIEVLKQ